MAPAESRISLWAETVDVKDGRATIWGQVWLGPVGVGTRFTSAATATDAEPVELQLEEITAPPAVQEPGRVPRVVAVLTGDGVDRLRSGVVLFGEDVS